MACGGTHLLARLLEVIARWLECAPADVPLDIAGYWLSPDQQHRTRVLLSRPSDTFPAWQEDDRDGAWRAVEHAWSTAAGCLRSGDRVIVLPGLAQPGRPRQRGTVRSVLWRTADHDPAHPDGRLGRHPDLAEVHVPGRTGPALQLHCSWRILLDTARHPGESSRAGVIAAHSAGTDLVLTSVLLRERGMHWTRDYLRWRAGLYPAGTAEIFAALAEAEPDADEVALARLRLPS